MNTSVRSEDKLGVAFFCCPWVGAGKGLALRCLIVMILLQTNLFCADKSGWVSAHVTSKPASPWHAQEEPDPKKRRMPHSCASSSGPSMKGCPWLCSKTTLRMQKSKGTSSSKQDSPVQPPWDCWSLCSASFGITSWSGSWDMGDSYRVPWRAARWDAAPCTPQQLPFPDPPQLTAICGVGISLFLSAAGPAPQPSFFLADLFIWVLHCSRPRLSFCCTWASVHSSGSFRHMGGASFYPKVSFGNW